MPVCRTSAPKSYGELTDRIKKRTEGGDADALNQNLNVVIVMGNMVCQKIIRRL